MYKCVVKITYNYFNFFLVHILTCPFSLHKKKKRFCSQIKCAKKAKNKAAIQKGKQSRVNSFFKSYMSYASSGVALSTPYLTLLFQQS